MSDPCGFSHPHPGQPCGVPREVPGTPCRHCGEPTPLDGEPCALCWRPITPADFKAMLAEHGIDTKAASVDIGPDGGHW